MLGLHLVFRLSLVWTLRCFESLVCISWTVLVLTLNVNNFAVRVQFGHSVLRIPVVYSFS